MPNTFYPRQKDWLARLNQLADDVAALDPGAALSSTDDLDEGEDNLYFTQARVRATPLTGLSLASSAAVTAASTGLQAIGQLQAQTTGNLALFTAHAGSGGNAHALAIAGGAAGFLSGSDKTKLDSYTGSSSGANTGDETTATIKAKLSISTLSGSNTGDEDTASIKSKLGVSTLSGSNTGDQLTFKTIVVAGQSDVVADANDDILTLVAGTNITITTTGDTITINSTGGGGGSAIEILEGGVSETAAVESINFTGAVNVTTVGNDVTIDISGAGIADTDALAEGDDNLYFTEDRVLDSVLVGLSLVTATPITSASTALQAFGQLQAQVTANASAAELASNKVTSVSGASTDAQYPSAKLVYDQLALKAPSLAPTLVGGSHTAITGLGIRSTGAAFDLTMASSEVLTAGRTLSWILGDAARSISLAGNLSYAGAFATIGAYACNLTLTGTTNLTFPTSGTVATLADIAGGGGISALTGDVVASGSGSVVATIANNAVSLDKMAQMATASLLGRNTASTGNVEVLSAATVQTLLGLGTAAYTATGAYAPAAGSASVTTLGTITTGVWDGTTIAAPRGGTGQTTYAVGDLLYASTTSALAKLAGVAAGNALISGGVSTAPSWGKVGLTTHVSGILAGTNGGSGVNNGSFTHTLTGNVAYSGAFNSTFTLTGATAVTFPTSGTLLSTAAAVTAPQGGTGQTTYAVGDLLYASTTSALSKLAAVAVGNVLISGGVSTAPSWSKVDLTVHVSGILPGANGGTGVANSGKTITLGGNLTTSGAFACTFTLTGTTTVTLPTSGTLATTAQIIGRQSFYVPATQMLGRSNNPATADTTATGSPEYFQLTNWGFDPTTQQYINFAYQMPKSWDPATTLSMDIYWKHDNTSVNFGVVWSIKCSAVNDSMNIYSTSYGTARTAAAIGADNQQIYKIGTSSITPGGTPTDESLMFFEISRAVANGSDTMAVPARIIGVRVYFTTNAATDA